MLDFFGELLCFSSLKTPHATLACSYLCLRPGEKDDRLRLQNISMKFEP